MNFHRFIAIATAVACLFSSPVTAASTHTPSFDAGMVNAGVTGRIHHANIIVACKRTGAGRMSVK